MKYTPLPTLTISETKAIVKRIEIMLRLRIHPRLGGPGTQKNWATAIRPLLEKCVRALTLLGICGERAPFFSKGGTIPPAPLFRTSAGFLDIDIVCPASRCELERVGARIGGNRPFSVRKEKPARQPMPTASTYQPPPLSKFWFRAKTRPKGRRFCPSRRRAGGPTVPTTRQVPLRTSFLIRTGKSTITLPTIESMLGDKLTASRPDHHRRSRLRRR